MQTQPFSRRVKLNLNSEFEKFIKLNFSTKRSALSPVMDLEYSRHVSDKPAFTIIFQMFYL